MSLSRKLTKGEADQIRKELVVIEERIRMKIRNITYTHKHLPYDRLAKGRRLKELCLLAIGFAEEGRMVDLEICLRELSKLGLVVQSYHKLLS